ncbi:hypothetical protein MMC16_001037 [Acarospora aff. strigata]|nr:hypothetical protein [Acarospora aff. strigata]
MTFQQEAASWLSPKHLDTAPVPRVGARAPSMDKVPLPDADGKPTLITFLRHCGCPFAEKTFITLRSLAAAHPSVQFVAVSHSDAEATARWVTSVGGAGPVRVVVDAEREVYARWGLGVSSFWHVLSPWSMFSVFKLGREEGIWNKPTESGNRWQTAGSFGIDGQGIVKWSRPAQSADDVPDIEEGLRMLEYREGP